MRQRMRTVGLLGVVATLILAACGGDEDTPTPVLTTLPTPTAAPVAATPIPTPTSEPTKTATFRFSTHNWSKPGPIWSPFREPLSSTNFDRLDRTDGDGVIVPQLATSFELVDQTTWRYHLRDDVRFHDGSPVMADDVVASLQSSVLGGASTYLAAMAVAVAVDEHTVDIKTTEPNMIFPGVIRRVTWVASKAQLEQPGESYEIKDVAKAGSGPWEYTDIVIGQSRAAEKLPDHPFRKVSVDRIEMFKIIEPGSVVAALRTGLIDLAEAALPPETAKGLESEGFEVKAVPKTVESLYLNPGDACRLGWPTCDAKVRRAINIAIDRQLLADELWGGLAQPAHVRNFPGTVGYNETIRFPYDPKRAEELLDEAGFPRGADGVRFELGYWNWITGASNDVALAVGDMLLGIGVKVDYKLVELGRYLEMYQRQDMEWKPLGQIANYFSSGEAAKEFATVCADCTLRYENEEFLSLKQQALAEPDESKRAEIVKRALVVLHEDPVSIPLLHTPEFNIWNASKWQGFTLQNQVFTLMDNWRPVQ